jgi:hypothetical protein
MATLWADKDFIVAKTKIDSNVDQKEIELAIEQAQDLDLMPWLGSYLYNTLNTHILAKINNNTTIPAAYKTLLDSYILKALPFFTISRMPLKFKYAHNGIMQRSGDNAQSADSIDVQRLEDAWKNIAQQYLKRTVDFLRLNAASYPEYLGSEGVSYQIYPRTDVYDSPIYLGPSTGTSESQYYNDTWIKRGY